MIARSILDEDALFRLAPAWRRLFRRAARVEIVLSPTWALTWWLEFGRDGRRLRALAIEGKGGRLQGLALFASRRVFHRRIVPLRRLELWMTGEPREHEIWSEYVGVLAEKGFEAEVADTVASAVASGAAGRFDELTISRASSDDPVLPALALALGERGFSVSLRGGATCPYAQLPATWDAYLASLKKGHRYAVRLSLSELEKWADGRPIELCAATDPRSTAEGLAVFRRMHAARWADQRPDGLFASERFARFHEQVVPRLAEDGLLDLLWLRLGDQPVAALYNLIVDGRSQVYQSGRVVAGVPRRLSLGTAMHALAIRRAIARGDHEYDFLGNPTLYKRQLSTHHRELVDLVAKSPRMRSQATASAMRVVEQVADRVRPYVKRTQRPSTSREPSASEPHDP